MVFEDGRHINIDMIGVPMPQSFIVGDRVRWSKAFSSDYKNAEGTIVRIVPVRAMPEFTLYDIRFEFGMHTLLASQIEPAHMSS